MSGSLREAVPPQAQIKRVGEPPVEGGGRTPRQLDSTSQGQEAVANPSPNHQIQVVRSLKLRLAMEMTEEMKEESVPLMD